MKVALAAYRKLVALAWADGRLAPAERERLERYRRALGLPPDAASLVPPDTSRVEIPAALLEVDASERVEVVRMLIDVAGADGEPDPVELERVERVAEALGVGPLQRARLRVEAHGRRQLHVGHHRRHAALACAGAAAVLALAVWMWRTGGSAARADQLAELEARLAALAESAEGGERVEKATRLFTIEFGDGDLVETLKAREAELRGSILLVVCEYVLEGDGRRVRRRSSGTGFFVSADGLLVTNKHVVEPWLFEPEVRRRLDSGWRLLQHELALGAWEVGALVLNADDQIEWTEGYSNLEGTLELAARAPDELERRSEPLPDGGSHESDYHVHGDGDLVLLRADVLDPVEPLELCAESEEPASLDHVMVLGYPWGLSFLDGGCADASPSIGCVRWNRDALFVTAPIVSGNSGGPIVDVEGRVAAVASRIYGDASFGAGIRPPHVRALLEGQRAGD